MNNQNPLRNRDKDKNEFPRGLAILGFVLVVFVWLTVFHPQFLESFSLPPATPVQKHETSREARSAAARISTPAEADPEPQAPQQATPPALQAPETSQSKDGDFFRYTDEEGVIHLVDNPDSIPERFRQKARVYRDTMPSTPVRIISNQILVPVTLRNGRQTVQATLVLDTGCSVTTISEELADRLKIDLYQTRPGTAQVADGRSVATRLATINEVTAGSKSKSPLEVSIMATSGPRQHADGLLGMNFLRDFRYQIDTTGQRILWK